MGGFSSYECVSRKHSIVLKFLLLSRMWRCACACLCSSARNILGVFGVFAYREWDIYGLFKFCSIPLLQDLIDININERSALLVMEPLCNSQPDRAMWVLFELSSSGAVLREPTVR